jgi:hypothetical protein
MMEHFTQTHVRTTQHTKEGGAFLERVKTESSGSAQLKRWQWLTLMTISLPRGGRWIQTAHFVKHHTLLQKQAKTAETVQV